MTQAIIDEEETSKKNKKDAYDFLEEDDDFEEFEIQGELADDEMMIDTGVTGGYEAEKKLWQEDWDDEEADEDFAKQLRAQIKK
jgi:26 proteasome complex subunit DSS1